MISKRILLIIPAVILVILAAAVISDLSDAEVRDNVRVFVEMDNAPHDPDDPSTSYYETSVSGVYSIREAADKALVQLDLSPLTLDNRGNIDTVGGITPGEGKYWVVHQWLPLGTPGWGEVGFGTSYDSKFLSGSSICIHMSSIEIVNNHARYTVPEFTPKSFGNVFIRFVTEYNNPKDTVQEAFTEDIRVEGFWLKGYGSCLGEVIMDAMEKNDFEFDAYSGYDSGGNSLLFWINSMFGLETVSYDSGAYAYWIQYTYVDNYWDYNSWTLGYYDPAVFSYVALFYGISEMGGTPDLGPEPDVEHMDVIKRYNSVTFTAGGTVYSEQTIEYGDYADVSIVDDPVPPTGYVFVRWDYDGSPITHDRAVNPVYNEAGDDRPKVLYYSEGTLVYTEYVTYGTSAKYDGVPQKKSTAMYSYEFTGWDSDLSNVTKDISTNAVFSQTLREYQVTFYDWDNSVILKTSAYYDSPVVCPEEPKRESSTKYDYTFYGWSYTYGGYVKADTEHIKGTTLCYAYYQKTDREYTVSFYDGGVLISDVKCRYGSMLDNSLAATLIDGYVLRFYNDIGLTDPVPLEYEILGDKRIYISKTPGDCTISESTAVISITNTMAKEIGTVSGRAKIADVSQISGVNTVSFGIDTLNVLKTSFDDTVVFEILLPKGSISISHTVLTRMSADNNSSFASNASEGTERTVSFTISSGRITSSINKLLSDYYDVYAYNVSAKIDGSSLTDLSGYGMVTVSLPASVTSNTVVYVASDMKLKIIGYTISGSSMVFNTTDLGLFCTCSDTEPAPGEIIKDPVGTIEYDSCGTGIKITKITGNSDGLYFVPQTHCGKTVVSVTSSSFSGLNGVRAVVLPITITSFDWNSNSVSFSSLIFLGDIPSFSGTRPSSVMVYASSEASGWESFDCETLKIHDYVGDGFSFSYYAIDDDAVILRWNYGSRIILPESVMADGTLCSMSYIESYAFSESDVKTVSIASSVIYIMDGAFYDSNISKISFSNGKSALMYIGERAFANTGVVNHDLPDSLVYIGYEAYRYCSKLTQIYLPDNVSILGEGAFSNCKDVTKIGLNASLTYVPARCFEFCYGLDHIEFGNDVKYIGKNAFSKCTSLHDVNLKNVENVGANAYYQCERLDYIVFGSNLKKLGTNAFSECGLNEGVDAYCERPEGLEDAFDDFSSVNLYVRSSVADSWSDYQYSLLDTPEEKEKTFDWQPIVLTAIVVLMVIMALMSLYIRKKMF